MATRPETAGSSRNRALRACEPCKQRKRRCDGTQPCATCIRYQYDCYFSVEARSRLKRAMRQTPAAGLAVHESIAAPPSTVPLLQQHADDTRQQPEQSLEATTRQGMSSSSFSGLLAKRLQPYHGGERLDRATRMTLLSEATTSSEAATSHALTSALSLENMQQFAANFFESVHPIFTFLRPNEVGEIIAARFSSTAASRPQDAIMFGIAALGSLFSDVGTAQEHQHVDLAQSTQALIDAETARIVTPTFDLVVALMLRTLYLRSTARTYATWVASCTAIHTITMMEIDLEVFTSLEQTQELYFFPRKTLWIARLLNTWIANEFGRPPVKTPLDASIIPPSPSNPVSASPEEQMVYLYHISEALNPENQGNPGNLEACILQLGTLDAKQTHDGVQLSLTILTLALHRLLRSSETTDLNRQTFACLVDIGLDGLQAATRLAQRHKPWWHLANVPFQFLCAMLVIDTASSFAQIPTALQAFKDVAQALPSTAITEALNLATRLVALSKVQKSEQLQHLTETLEPTDEHAPTARNVLTEDLQAQSQAAGFSVPWQMPDMEGLEQFSDPDWSFLHLPNMDIPLFDLDV